MGAAVVCPAAKQQLIVANGATCGGVHTDPPTQGRFCMTHERLGGLTSNFRCHAYVKNCVDAFYGKYSRVVQREVLRTGQQSRLGRRSNRSSSANSLSGGKHAYARHSAPSKLLIDMWHLGLDAH